MSREEERNLNDRNINPRYSRIAGSFLHDNTINESSSSEEEELNHPNLEVIQKEEVDSSDTDSHPNDNENIEMAEEQPVTSSQLSAVHTFDGKTGEGFVNWLERLKVTQVTYN